VVSTFGSEQEARFEELRLSLRYGIPQLPFVARQRKRLTGCSLVEDQEMLDRLFASIDTRNAAERLMADQGLSAAHPHHLPQSADGRRRTVFVTLCARKRMHRIEVRGCDGDVAERLRGVGYQPRHVSGKAPGHWALRFEERDVDALMLHAERICTLSDARPD
jgi:DNA helicase II / ATP-dependent DNA helicase PcrA